MDTTHAPARPTATHRGFVSGDLILWLSDDMTRATHVEFRARETWSAIYGRDAQGRWVPDLAPDAQLRLSAERARVSAPLSYAGEIVPNATRQPGAGTDHWSSCVVLGWHAAREWDAQAYEVTSMELAGVTDALDADARYVVSPIGERMSARDSEQARLMIDAALELIASADPMRLPHARCA